MINEGHMRKTDSSGICYNPDTSCFTPIVLFDMCNTTLDCSVQIKYKIKDGARKTKRMAL